MLVKLPALNRHLIDKFYSAIFVTKTVSSYFHLLDSSLVNSNRKKYQMLSLRICLTTFKSIFGQKLNFMHTKVTVTSYLGEQLKNCVYYHIWLRIHFWCISFDISLKGSSVGTANLIIKVVCKMSVEWRSSWQLSTCYRMRWRIGNVEDHTLNDLSTQ